MLKCFTSLRDTWFENFISYRHLFSLNMYFESVNKNASIHGYWEFESLLEHLFNGLDWAVWVVKTLKYGPFEILVPSLIFLDFHTVPVLQTSFWQDAEKKKKKSLSVFDKITREFQLSHFTLWEEKIHDHSISATPHAPLIVFPTRDKMKKLKFLCYLVKHVQP